MLNIRDFGAIGDGITDDTNAIKATIAAAPNHSVIYIPEDSYLISETIDCGDKSLRIIGDCAGQAGVPELGGSFLTGIVNGPLLKINESSNAASVSDIGFNNRYITGIGLKIAGHTNSVERVSICAFIGLDASGNVFTLSLKDIHGVSFTPIPIGSVGVLISGHTSLQSFDLTNWDNAVRASGSGIDIRQGRVEVNNVGLMLGMNAIGQSWILGATTIEGITLEANEIAIISRNLVSSHIGQISIQGSVNSPSHQSQRGMLVEFAQECEFSNIVTSGSYAISAIEVWNSNVPSNWNNIFPTNNFFGAKIWDIKSKLSSFRIN